MSFMGYTMRTSNYRYTAWFSWNTTTLRPNLSEIGGEELYNLTTDVGTNFDLPAYQRSVAGDSSYNQILIESRNYLTEVVEGWNT